MGALRIAEAPKVTSEVVAEREDGRLSKPSRQLDGVLVGGVHREERLSPTRPLGRGRTGGGRRECEHDRRGHRGSWAGPEGERALSGCNIPYLS